MLAVLGDDFVAVLCSFPLMMTLCILTIRLLETVGEESCGVIYCELFWFLDSILCNTL